MKHLARLFLVVALAGCEISGPDHDGLDLQLEDALIQASDGAGISYFRLPPDGDLSAIPQDPNNPLTPEKVALGRLLFHETALATDPIRREGGGTYSCASCHHAAAGFQAGVAQGIGEGGVGFGLRGEGRSPHPEYADYELDVQPIRSPSAMNAAYQQVMLWNGQFGATGPNVGTESLWRDGTLVASNHLGFEGIETQAIAALAVHRMASPRFATLETSLVATDPVYQERWQAAFPGEGITRIRAGLAIAAYERTLLSNQAPFQRWLAGDESAMDRQSKEGGLLFFGKAGCVSCHTGPALNSMSFHALGMADLAGPSVVIPPDNPIDPLGRGGFTLRPEDNYRFKTPQLYNLADSPLLGHGASFSSVREVVAYKNRAVPENPVAVVNLSGEFVPLGLSSAEIDALTAFIERGLRDPDLQRFVPAGLPSGNCFPVNDPAARVDLGCD